MWYIIGMNFLNNDDTDEQHDANDVTSQAMSALWDIAIAPNQEKFTEEEQSMIALIGITLKVVAHKASLYEQEHEQIGSTPSDSNWRN